MDARNGGHSPAEALRRAGEALIAAADALTVADARGGEEVTLAEIREAEAGPRVPHEAVVAMMEGVHPVQAMRKARGLTQKALAEAVGSSANYVSQIENGRPAGRKMLRKLADALGTAPDVLDPDA